MSTENLETKIGIALDQLSRIREDIKSLDEKITRDYATKYEVEAIHNRVEKVEANLTWVVRTVMGAIIAGVLTFFYTFTGKL